MAAGVIALEQSVLLCLSLVSGGKHAQFLHTCTEHQVRWCLVHGGEHTLFLHVATYKTAIFSQYFHLN